MSEVPLPLYQFVDGRVIDLREVCFISEVDPSDEPWRPGFNVYLKHLDTPLGFVIGSLREKVGAEFGEWLLQQHAALIEAWGKAVAG